MKKAKQKAKRRTLPTLHPHKASGQFRAKIPGTDTHKYFGKDPIEAERRHRAWCAELLAGGAAVSPARGSIVSEALARYEAHAGTYYEGSTQIVRVRRALDAVRALYGPEPVAAFGAPQLKAVRASLLERDTLRWGKKPDAELARPRGTLKDRPPAKLSRNYVNSLIGCIQTAWTWLESEGLVPRGTAEHLYTVTPLAPGKGGEETPPVLAVAPALVAATLPHLGPVVAAMVRLQQFTGMRPGEVCRLTPALLSTDPARPVRVPIGKGKFFEAAAECDAGGVLCWIYAPATHKLTHKGKMRVIAFGPQAQEVLRPFLDRPPEAHCFSPAESVAAYRRRQQEEREARGGRGRPKPRKKVRRPKRRPGTRYTTESYGTAIRHACERHGIEPWAPNQLRHFVLGEIRDAEGIESAQAAGGHSSADMTMHYAKQSITLAVAAAAKHG
jgi:integrase